MRKLRVDEQIIQLVQAMHCKVRSKTSIENCFVLMIVHVGVNQGSVLNQLLFIMVEAITLKFINGCPWECCMVTIL